MRSQLPAPVQAVIWMGDGEMKIRKALALMIVSLAAANMTGCQKNGASEVSSSSEAEASVPSVKSSEAKMPAAQVKSAGYDSGKNRKSDSGENGREENEIFSKDDLVH